MQVSVVKWPCIVILNRAKAATFKRSSLITTSLRRHQHHDILSCPYTLIESRFDLLLDLQMNLTSSFSQHTSHSRSCAALAQHQPRELFLRVALNQLHLVSEACQPLSRQPSLPECKNQEQTRVLLDVKYIGVCG